MASCDYYVLQSIYEVINDKLEAIGTSLDELDLSVKIDELDVDLDNLESQLKIANKLKLLELVGTDIVSEENQKAIYEEIADELLSPTSFGVSAPGPIEQGDEF